MAKDVVEVAMGKMRRTWTLRTGGNIMDEDDPYTKSRYERAQKRLFLCFADVQPETVPASPSFAWFQDHVEAQASLVWNTLITQSICGLDIETRPSSRHAKAILFEFISNVVAAFADKEDISLEDVVEKLREQDDALEVANRPRFLRSDAGNLHHQLIFQILGWITGFYAPSTDLDLEHFTIADEGSQSGRRSVLYIPTIRHLKVKVNVKNRPIYELLNRFGDLLPKPDSLLHDGDLDRYDVETACITTAYVSYHHLTNTLKCELRWTHTIGQHLEYDRRRKVLYVFSAPSICSLVLQTGDHSVLLTILEQFRQSRKQAHDYYREAELKTYLAEILLSYRLIFASHKKSRRQIQPLLTTTKKDAAAAGSSKPYCDPLLHALCTKDSTCPEVRELLADLGVDEIADYVPLEEFQFLGKRLMRLENISKSQSPSGLRRFWRDRRNPKEWFAVWVVIILGGGTLLLQALQMVFQIWQPPIGGNKPS